MPLLGEAIIAEPGSQMRPLPADYPVARIGLRTGFFVCLALSVLMLATGVVVGLFWPNSPNVPLRRGAYVVMRLGAGGVCISVVLAVYKLVVEDWIIGNSRMRLEAFCSRDRRGRRLASPEVIRCLDAYVQSVLFQSNDGQRILEEQPDDSLLSLMSPKSSKRRIRSNAISRILDASASLRSPAENPACTILKKLDLIEDDDSAIRSAMARSLPPTLWSRAMKKLLRSKHPEAKIAAIKCTRISRRVLMRICKHAKESQLRQAAWRRIKDDLTASEATKLHDSVFHDVRLNVVRSALISRKLIIKLCINDKEPVVREAAWYGIKDNLTPDEATSVIRSLYSDARLYSVGSGVLPRKEMIRLCRADDAPGIRDAAWDGIKGNLTRGDAAELIRSSDARLRLNVVQTGNLPRNCVVKLCRKDEQPEVRLAAWNQIEEDLTRSEARMLSRSRFEDTRGRAAHSELLSWARLQFLRLRSNIARRNKEAKSKNRNQRR